MIGWPSMVTRAVLVSSLHRPALDVALGVAGGAAHLGPHARQQLLHVEGLGDVVVGAGVHARHLVAPAVARREDDHRHVAFRAPPLLQHADAVHLRQAGVEDDHVVGFGVAEEEAFLAIEGGIDGVARVGERRDELPVEIAIVLDNQNPQVVPPAMPGASGVRTGVCPPSAGRVRPSLII